MEDLLDRIKSGRYQAPPAWILGDDLLRHGHGEWFTPEKYIAAAREVMGGIDLDPATHPLAQETIQAATFFTREDDGLLKDWVGRVWLCPPYARALIGKFVEKLVAEIDAPRTTQAILLTHNSTDTKWFHLAASRAPLICFTRGRIKFANPDGKACAPTQGQAFFYFGDNTEAFRYIFSNFGFVTRKAAR